MIYKFEIYGDPSGLGIRLFNYSKHNSQMYIGLIGIKNNICDFNTVRLFPRTIDINDDTSYNEYFKETSESLNKY